MQSVSKDVISAYEISWDPFESRQLTGSVEDGKWPDEHLPFPWATHKGESGSSPWLTHVCRSLLGSPLPRLVCCHTEMRPSFFARGSIFTAVETLLAPCSLGCWVTKASCLPPGVLPHLLARLWFGITQSPRQGQSKGSLFAGLTTVLPVC